MSRKSRYHGSVYLLLFFLLSFLLQLATATKRQRPSDSSEGYSYAENTFHYEDATYFTKTDLFRIRKFLPMLPNRSPRLDSLHDIAREHPEGYRVDIDQVLTQSHDRFIDTLVRDQSSRDAFFGTGSRVITSFNADVDEKVDVDDIPEVEERNQTQGWEGCLRDYNMVMLPETVDYQRTLALIINDMIRPLPPIVEVPEVPPANPVAIQIVDAIGKRPAGLAMGGLHWVGAVQLCEITGLRYEWNFTEIRLFKGKYARIALPIFLENVTTLWPFEIGLCVPDTCSEADIVRYVAAENDAMIPYLVGTGQVRNITNIFTGYVTDFANDPGAKGSVALLIIAVMLCLIASCYDGWGRDLMIRDRIQDKIGGRKGNELTLTDMKMAEDYLYGKPSVGDRIETAWAGFSVYSNLRHMYTINKSNEDDRIRALDGIKGICFLWLVRGLIYVYGPVYFETWTTANLLNAIPRYLDSWQTTAWISVTYANHAFFYVSGFLCVHTFIRQYERNDEKITFWFVCRYFLHRLWWFLPTILGVVIIYAWFYKYLGYGPLTSPQVTDAENCKETWWLLALLFNNLFQTDQQCWGWSWVFAVLWQLHIASIFVVIPLVLLPVAGYIMTAFMYIAHIVILAIWEQRNYDGDGISWYTDILQTPWCNAGPWIIGMIFAMIIKNVDRKKKWHWAPILILWLMATAGILTVIFAPWDKLKDDQDPWSREGEITFGVLAPQLFALSLGWVTFACWKGYGGIIGKFFHWRFFTWMSNMMMLSTIFMGPPIQLYFMGQRTPFYLNESNMGKAYSACLINIFIYANAIGLVFTYPYTRGVLTAVRAKTRLELFLWAKHPKVMSDFTGNPRKDIPRLKRLLAREQKEQGSPDLTRKFITGDKIKGMPGISSAPETMKGQQAASYLPENDLTFL